MLATLHEFFDYTTAQFNKHAIGQRVVAGPNRQGIEGLG
jgi:hypothetical protein